MISARGLRRRWPSLWRLQWFAVGWIDPDNKYCTRIDDSGNLNPVWKTKFLSPVLVDTRSSLEDMDANLALHVEVYSREPLFLRERLHGTATVTLKEFLTNNDSDPEFGIERVGSFQLRKGGGSDKPRGLVDISIRISRESEEPTSYPGNEEFELLGHENGITLSTREGATQGYQPPMPLPTLWQPINNPHISLPHAHMIPQAANSFNVPSSRPSSSSVGGMSYHRPQIPPPSSNLGYMPTFPPTADSPGAYHM